MNDPSPRPSAGGAVPRSARTPAAVWALRLLTESNVYEHVSREHDWPNQDLCLTLALNRKEIRALDRGGSDAGAQREFFAGRLAAIEAAGVPPNSIERNVRWLAERVQLRPIERDVLHFLVVFEESAALQQLVGALPFGGRAARQLVAHALGHAASAFDWSLRPKGTLWAAHLVQFGPGRSRLGVGVSDGLAKVLSGEYPDAEALLARFFSRSAEPALRTSDFPHLSEWSEVIVRLLRAARRPRVKGVNVLLYGPPGSGKTELGRALARAAGMKLFEVASEDDDGLSALGGPRRIAAWALCQRMLARVSDAAVMFDEAEDAFPRIELGFGLRRETGGSKGWLNTLLESNPRPTFWVTNAVDHIDAAHLRRFDIALEVGIPPLRVRKQIVTSVVQSLPVSAKWIDRCAADERVRSGHISRAARVVRLLAVRKPEEAERTMSRVIQASLEVVGEVPSRALQPSDPCAYDRALVNASVDLDQVVRGLSRSKRGTLCLHGPPGTGKSAFVAHLARELDLPLHARRASELLSMYVGGTERNLARAFQRAASERVLLFLDEADSFLQDRTRAARQWEVTQVNELLVQMEAFPGVFVCATNLMDSLDRASLRRFAIKVELRPLRPEQRWNLLAATLEAHGAEVPGGAQAELVRHELARLDGITPGDFAAVVRRCDAMGEGVSLPALLTGLADEVRTREGVASMKIGFR